MSMRPINFPKIRCFFRRENGTQLVELAIVTPVMLILLGGLAEFGRFFYTYTTLTNAVRGGARHASKWERGASWMNGACAETEKFVVYGGFGCSPGSPAILPGLTEGLVVVQANGPSVYKIDSVTVKIVGYKYKPLFDLGKLDGHSSSFAQYRYERERHYAPAV